jgi:hypothetical protein
MDGGSDSTAGSGSKCVAVVDCKVWETLAYINGRVFYRWGDLGGRQLQVLGDAIDRKMQNVWTAPLVRSVNTLEKFNALIPPIIRQHYEDIVGRSSGYQGYRRAMPNVEDTRWDWQVHVSCSIGGNNVG